MLARIVLSVLLGLCLARYNVLAMLIAIALVVAGSAILDVVDDAPLIHSVLAGAIVIVFLPVGYLIGQLLRASQK